MKRLTEVIFKVTRVVSPVLLFSVGTVILTLLVHKTLPQDA